MSEHTAIVQQYGEWWIGWIEEVPGVNCQESSREALLETLRITLEEALESNRSETGALRHGNAREMFETRAEATHASELTPHTRSAPRNPATP